MKLDRTARTTSSSAGSSRVTTGAHGTRGAGGVGKAGVVVTKSVDGGGPLLTAPIPKGAKKKALSDAAAQASARELAVHARELGVPLTGDVDAITKAIQDEELALAQKHDPRVSQADMDRAVLWSQKAALLEPARQSDLFGFTRVVDKKLGLTPELVEILARACGDEAAVKRAVDAGPGQGEIAWAKPQTPVELVASLVRQLALAGGASRQIVLTPELVGWLDAVLADHGVDVKSAMGGAGAFAANLAFGAGVDATFYSGDPLPTAIAERFASGVKVAGKTGAVTSMKANASDAVAARQNTSTEYGAGAVYTLFGERAVQVNGVAQGVVPVGTGRVILGTQAKDVKPGFDHVDGAALRKMGKANDVFFFVGAHYLTQSPVDAGTIPEAQALGRALDEMKEANPGLLRHAQYVTPKVFETEPLVWGALKGHIDSLALNAVEVAPFVDSLFDGKLSGVDIDPHLPRDAAEDPAHMLEGALAIVDALDLSRVQLHGLEGDLVVTKAALGVDPERQKLAILKARQLASNKAANESGEIKSGDDIWPVIPSVRGTGLAAVQRFADAVQHRFGLSDKERDDVAARWFFEKDGVVIHFVPSRGIHDRTGGTVSLGDTIDSASLIYAIEPKRAPKLLHGSSFP